MIKVSEQEHKRFRIDTKFNLENKNINKIVSKKNNSFNIHLRHNNLSELQKQLTDLQKKYNDLKLQINDENQKNYISELNKLEEKIKIKSSQLQELTKFSDRNIIKTQNITYSAKTIRLGFLYKIDKLIYKIICCLFIGAFVSTSIWLLVQYTGVYTPGISGIVQGIAKIVKIEILNSNNPKIANSIYNALFWGLYFFINVPLIIFSRYKVNKQFSILTLFYVVSSQLVGFLLGFINNGNGIFIFNDMSSNSLKDIYGYIENVQLLPWNANESLVFGLFIYSLTYSSINGLGYSSIYILGGSAGGTDIFGFYYAKVKNKSISNLLITINIISLIIGVILGSFTCWMIQANHLGILSDFTKSRIVSVFFSPNLVASILGSVVAGIIYSYFFPKNKVIKVQIYSNKISEIAIALKASEWKYKLAITNIDSNILGDDANSSSRSLETICFYIDMPMLISIMRSIDNQGLITIYSTFGFSGELPSSSYEK